MASNVHNLALREKSVSELRALAALHTTLKPEEIEAADKVDLVAALSEEATTNGTLARGLKKDGIAIKPSFYLLSINEAKTDLPTERTASNRLNAEFMRISAQLENHRGVPTLKAFAVEHVDHTSKAIVEVHFTWHKALFYWSPEVTLETVYELQFGFAILDLQQRKAIVACHTETERDNIVKAISACYGFKLTPLTLTKELLDQIGTFDKVKRASYYIGTNDRSAPENITYADERLATIAIARQEEENARSVRQLSFYRIPIGDTVVEQGVGATSQSGKLWIPRETPISACRDFGIGLLKKISKTVDALGRRNEVSQLATVLGLSTIPEISVITPLELREKVVELTRQLANMLLKGTRESQFPTPIQFAVGGVPRLFNPPALLLTDNTTGDTVAWSDEEGHRLVEVVEEEQRIVVKSYPQGGVLRLTKLEHPLTGNEIDVAAPLSSLMLLPTPLLQEAVEAGIRLFASHVPKLVGVTSVPFWLSQDTLRLDSKRAFGTSSSELLRTELSPQDVNELRNAIKVAPPTDRAATMKLLRSLGEKCRHMTDHNCRECLSERKYLCLRSLVAGFFDRQLLLAHKSIELSDGQFEGTVGAQQAKMFAFAKLAPTEKEDSRREITTGQSCSRR